MSETGERIKYCRARADQCRAWADIARSPATHDDFLNVAAQWDLLAKEIAEIEQARINVQMPATG